MADLTLISGNFRYSSWSMRGWLAAKQTGLDLQVSKFALYVEEEMEKLRALSPSGMVPALVDHRSGRDLHVWDSLAIIDYLNDTTDTAFWPEDRASLALARSLAAEMHSGYMPLRTACPMNLSLSVSGLPLSDTLKATLDHLCRQLGRALDQDRDGDFLFGGWGAVDIMFAPVATRIRSYGLPVTPQITAWVDAVFDQKDVQIWVQEAATETWGYPGTDGAVQDGRLVYDT